MCRTSYGGAGVSSGNESLTSKRDCHSAETRHLNVVSFVAAEKSHTPLVRLTVADGLTTDLTGVKSRGE